MIRVNSNELASPMTFYLVQGFHLCYSSVNALLLLFPLALVLYSIVYTQLLSNQSHSIKTQEKLFLNIGDMSGLPLSLRQPSLCLGISTAQGLLGSSSQVLTFVFFFFCKKIKSSALTVSNFHSLITSLRFSSNE